MELAGNEKRIQALFRDLKFTDERVAPQFISVWNRAQAIPTASSRVLKLSFALAVSVVVITLCSLVLWSWNWQRIQTSTPDLAGGSEKPGSMPALPSVAPGFTQLVIAESHHRSKARRWGRKLAARHQPEINAANAVIPETVAISSWQSPTAMLLQSPADDVLTSLPQLDLSLKDLKTFLPDTLQ
jgi:hypothetical protein